MEKEGKGAADVDETYSGLARLLNVVNGALRAGTTIYDEPFQKWVSQSGS